MRSFNASGLTWDDLCMTLEVELFNQIPDERYYALGKKIWDQIGDKMRKGFGARSHHHNYEGGLLDHSLEVAFMALRCARALGEKVNESELILGAFYHDIGKLDSYRFDHQNDEIEKTEVDRLIGHFGVGLVALWEFMKDSGLNDGEKDRLAHILVAHHGPVSNGWGSLVDPVTPEAHIVHYVDLISSRVGGDKPKL